MDRPLSSACRTGHNDSQHDRVRRRWTEDTECESQKHHDARRTGTNFCAQQAVIPRSSRNLSSRMCLVTERARVGCCGLLQPVQVAACLRCRVPKTARLCVHHKRALFAPCGRLRSNVADMQSVHAIWHKHVMQQCKLPTIHAKCEKQHCCTCPLQSEGSCTCAALSSKVARAAVGIGVLPPLASHLNHAETVDPAAASKKW
jgi:hypothetical protein